MDKSEKEELRSEIYEFMLAYQDEHSDEPIPPTLAEIEKHFDLSGRNVALAYVLELVEEGLVEVLPRGWRKYAARVINETSSEDESVTPVRMEGCLYWVAGECQRCWPLPSIEGRTSDATTKTPAT